MNNGSVRNSNNRALYVLYMVLVLSYEFIILYISSRLTGLLSLAIIFFSLYFFFLANSRYHLPKVMKSLNILVVMFTIYGIILIASEKDLYIQEVWSLIPNRTYLIELYKSILPIYAFYVFTRQGYLTEKTMRVFFLVFFALSIASYFATRTVNLTRAQELDEYVVDVTNGSGGYLMLSLLPFLVFFDKRPLFKYVALIVIGGLVLYAIKRGAILIFFICLLFYLPQILKNSTPIARFITIVAIVIGGFYAYNSIVDFIASNTYFSNRVDLVKEGNLEARSGIWLGLFSAFLDADLFQMLFGRGAWATLEVGTNFAHNDWLEILTNQGLLGIVLFSVYWYGFYKAWRNSKQTSMLYNVLGLLFLTHFIRTFFSMSISDTPYYATCLMGYAFAVYSIMVKERTIERMINHNTLLTDDGIVK